MKTAQEFYDRVTELKDNAKVIYEELDKLFEDFAKENGDFELPILDKDGKAKFVRVYEPEGHFVYNKKYEVGTRVKAVNPKV